MQALLKYDDSSEEESTKSQTIKSITINVNPEIQEVIFFFQSSLSILEYTKNILL